MWNLPSHIKRRGWLLIFILKRVCSITLICMAYDLPAWYLLLSYSHVTQGNNMILYRYWLGNSSVWVLCIKTGLFIDATCWKITKSLLCLQRAKPCCLACYCETNRRKRGKGLPNGNKEQHQAILSTILCIPDGIVG